MNKFKAITVAAIAALTLSACQDEATVARNNATTAADNFEIVRNIVFYNVWRGEEVVQVVGKCSVEQDSHRVDILCKEGEDENGHGIFKRHYMGKTTNLTYLSTQVDTISLSTQHTKIVWRPLNVIPDIDIRGDVDQLKALVTN